MGKGKSAKDKGRRGEHKVVDFHTALGVPSFRMPLSGSLGGILKGDQVVGAASKDELVDPQRPLFRGETKWRKKGEGFTTIKRWLGEHDILFLLENHKPMTVVMTSEMYAKLIERYYHGRESENLDLPDTSLLDDDGVSAEDREISSDTRAVAAQPEHMGDSQDRSGESLD